MGEKINEYFRICRDGRLPLTIGGLVIHLDVDRGLLEDYESRPGFFHIIKKAREIIAVDKEMGALSGAYNPAMAIFSLKHNHGWKDTQNITVNGASEFFQSILAKSDNVDEDGRVKK